MKTSRYRFIGAKGRIEEKIVPKTVINLKQLISADSKEA